MRMETIAAHFSNPDRISNLIKALRENKQFVASVEKFKINCAEKKRTYQKKYTRERRIKDAKFRLLGNLRNRLRFAVSAAGGKKQSRTSNLIGCSIEQLRKHLESLFKEGMTWDNYGQWHVDHIRPCCSFNLLDEKEQSKCFHYTNLQPLWAKDNFAKSGKYDLSKVRF